MTGLLPAGALVVVAAAVVLAVVVAVVTAVVVVVGTCAVVVVVAAAAVVVVMVELAGPLTSANGKPSNCAGVGAVAEVAPAALAIVISTKPLAEVFTVKFEQTCQSVVVVL